MGSWIRSWIRKKKINGAVGEIQVRSEVNNIASMLTFWFRKLYYDYLRQDGSIEERDVMAHERAKENLDVPFLQCFLSLQYCQVKWLKN